MFVVFSIFTDLEHDILTFLNAVLFLCWFIVLDPCNLLAHVFGLFMDVIGDVYVPNGVMRVIAVLIVVFRTCYKRNFDSWRKSEEYLRKVVFLGVY